MIVTNNRKKCSVTYSEVPLFFSLVDYRNNYFTSDDPNKIIEFYNGFENREQLIWWMKERPKGVANIHEVEGDKDIIVVIPTADFNGKYAKECRENIFKGLHIIFVESGEIPDPYFNGAHNVNIGIKKAMEYNPRWIVFSNDDVYKIDSVEKLKRELAEINNEKYNYVALPPSAYHSQVTAIGKRIEFTNLLYFILKYRRLGFTRFKIERKFYVKYNRFQTTGVSRLLGKLFFRTKKIIIENGDVAIFSSQYVKSLNGDVYDETFINAFEETELALRLNFEVDKIARIEYQIGDYMGSTLGVGTKRLIHDLAGVIYFNEKWYNRLEAL
jgi:hypothetical protein